MQDEDWPRRSASTRPCACVSATMTPPCSTISPGPIRRAGDLASAVPLARRAWSLDRNNPATADTLGWLLFKAGRRAEGLALLERAARGAPEQSRRSASASRRRDGADPCRQRSAGRSRFSSPIGITMTSGCSRRRRSMNCEASPTITTVVFCGSSRSRGRALRLGRRHRQHAGQIAADLVRAQAARHIACRSRPAMPAVVSVSRPKSPVSEARRAVSSAAGDRLGAKPPHLGQDQAEHLRGGVVAGLDGGGERSRLAPRLDAAAGAVGKAAADADLLVEPRAVAAAEHGIGDERAIVTRVAAGRSCCARPRPPPGRRRACR